MHERSARYTEADRLHDHALPGVENADAMRTRTDEGKPIIATRTPHRLIENAQRTRLRITAAHALEIMLRRPINSNIDDMCRGMNDCFTLVGDVGGSCKGIAIYAPDDQGRFEVAITLDSFPEDLTHCDRLPLLEAYAIPEGVVFADGGGLRNGHEHHPSHRRRSEAGLQAADRPAKPMGAFWPIRSSAAELSVTLGGVSHNAII